ncbi:Adenosylcobinamide kinase / Adenosylcobinamide-phosphate guanylyltransferase [hydrothermal vent metagenome]|uniref:Adenosylcobinamide kinase n=1 Tax=hydrothermal vent metagenome TaxID=652676 RepID=A0A3B0UJD0_9ZZZZ
MRTGHTLVLGGARSGKSFFAERLALSLNKTPAYIATAQSGDGEMASRIKKHRERRGESFVTYQEPLKLAETIAMAAGAHDVILVDCLTLWLTNLMFCKTTDTEKSIDDLLDTLKSLNNTKIIMVSNEVGMGIVPEHEISRLFRDRIGELHQQLANICKEVYFVAAGLPLALKGKLAELE